MPFAGACAKLSSIAARCLQLPQEATGMTKIKMLEEYGGAGLALVEASAKFSVPSQYGDDFEFHHLRQGVRPLELLHAAQRLRALFAEALARLAGPDR